MAKVAILGAAGNMGSALTRNLAKAGHEIYVQGPHADKIDALIANVKKDVPNAKINAAKNTNEATKNAEIIIPAVWYAMQAQIAKEISNAAKGKIVVNIVNPLNNTYDDVATAPDTSAAEELAKLLPNSKVVKAFNTAFGMDYVNPKFAGVEPDIFVAGDDEKAVEIVSKLVKDAGFNPLYVGKLSASRTLERMTVLLISLSQRYGYNWVAGWKVLHK